MAQPTWTWGSVAPDRWFADRAKGSVLVRGYLSIGARIPPRDGFGDALWSYDLGGDDLLLAVRHGSFDVPRPISVRYLGDGKLSLEGPNEVARLPDGTYTILLTPVSSVLTEIDGPAERAAMGRLDAAAGLVSLTVSPNAVYQPAFEFFQEATGTGVQVLGGAMRNAARSPNPTLTKEGLSGLKRALDALYTARVTIRRRVDVSLRWYAQAMSERNRVDAFLKFWIAIEALASSGNGSTVPLVEALAAAYQQEKQWVRSTFAVDQLARLRGAIVHSGRQPMVHGHVLELVACPAESAGCSRSRCRPTPRSGSRRRRARARRRRERPGGRSRARRARRAPSPRALGRRFAGGTRRSENAPPGGPGHSAVARTVSCSANHAP